MAYEEALQKITKNRKYWDRNINEWGGGNMHPGTADVLSTGTVTLATGASGSVDSIEVNSVEVMSGVENFDTSLAITATAVAANITANTSVPDYNAVAVGAVITISAVTAGETPNGFTVVSTATTITTADTNMIGGFDKDIVHPTYQIPNTNTMITFSSPLMLEKTFARKFDKRNLSS